MKLALHPYTLTLAHSFGISRERHDQQETLIVALSHEGETGYGEATANTYYKVRIPDLVNEIERARVLIENASPTDPQALYHLLREAHLSSFACCALDMAAWDLFGKLEGKPLYQLWGTTMEKYPVTNYTIGLDTIEVMVAKMKEIPWPVYKIKLGTDRDVAIVTELRKHTDAIFRVDANCAWKARETIENALALKELGVEFIEQPLPADDWVGMERVAHRCVLPVMADESCLTASDVSACALHFSGINIKLTKCGGLTPARQMIQNARELGLKVMVGCMTESTVGISAIAQLLPQLDYVDMDGAMLLKSDIATGVRLEEGGRIILPALAGSGVSLLP
ncbi:dipeptide epimerase [Robiginitalea sp.]|uniref:dipeptide epimerase n=1 Tax=Robiginitalea sp. TaxID=1902411 RepID=UPI003C786AC4